MDRKEWGRFVAALCATRLEVERKQVTYEYVGSPLTKIPWAKFSYVGSYPMGSPSFTPCQKLTQ